MHFLDARGLDAEDGRYSFAAASLPESRAVQGRVVVGERNEAQATLGAQVRN
jgi:hypothetical protein